VAVSGDSSDPKVTFSEDSVDPGSIDDREQPRFGVDVSVTVNSEHNFYAGVACNLSSGGVFVSTHIVHPVGTRFNVSIHLDDEDAGVVRGTGEVRWVRPATENEALPAGLGIRFVSISDDDLARIERFLAKRDPMLVGESKAPPVSS